MRVHFIAIGGAAIHNLALALHEKGAVVTGSDDAIFNPSNLDWKRQVFCPKNRLVFQVRLIPI